MKKHLLFLITLLLTGMTLFGQTSITLTFMGRDQHNAYVRLDNVIIQNLTRGWTEAISFPDTVYTLTVGTGIDDYVQGNEMKVMPNPFDGKTQLNLYSVKGETARMVIVDITGKKCAEYHGNLSQGDNYFEIMLTTPQTYILSVQTADGTHSVKMVNTGRAGANQISLVGGESNVAKVKISSNRSHIFELGDEMRYTGYSQQSNGLIPSTPVTQQQYESGVITLSFELANDAELPIVATVAASNIGTNMATTGGNVFSDGGATVTARGVCYSVVPNPTLAENHTADGTGTGAFTSSLTNLVENTTYYVRAYATNSAGTAYGQEVSFTTETGSSTGQSCPGTPTVTDYDGNIYNTVQIGNQCWMKENLRTTHYANGTPIQAGQVDSWYNMRYYDIAYRYMPNNNSMTVSTYGYLYNRPALMHGSESSNTNPSGVLGICPSGWHVPSYAEWSDLLNYVKYQPENQCNGNLNFIAKSLASTSGWLNSNESECVVGYQPYTTNNATGFSAMPAGAYPAEDGNFGMTSVYWTATEDDYYNQWYMTYYGEEIYWGEMNGLASVRCVKNQEIPAQTTAEVMTLKVVDGETTVACKAEIITDGGSAVTARGFCWSETENPTVENNHTTNGSGVGIYTADITGMTVGVRYFVRAYATNNTGTAYGKQVAVTIHPPCPNSPIVTDIDNNTYRTIKIGHQCWMKENLRTTRFANGDSIVLGEDRFDLTDVGDENNYGFYYSGNIVTNGIHSNANPSGIQGVCPNGWHVPSYAEWQELFDTIRGRSEYLCNGDTANIAKALSTTYGWKNSSVECAVGNNQNYNDGTGFSAIPIYYFGRYTISGEGGSVVFSANHIARAGFWSATENSAISPYYHILHDFEWTSSSVGVSVPQYSSINAVRCVREADTVITMPVSYITASLATGGGKVATMAGNTITARGVCWSTTHNPTIADNYTTDNVGVGVFASNLTGLADSTTYYVRAYITNSHGTFYGNEVTFTTLPIPRDGQVCAIGLKDYEGNIYSTVQIGSQCWMKENLRTKHYTAGTALTQITSNTSYISTPGYYQSSYGSDVLYNKYCVGFSDSNPSGIQGVCPKGWHVPSQSEWNQLAYYVSSKNEWLCGYNSSNIAKALSAQTGWGSSSNTCAVGNNPSLNNATGFSAAPTDYYPSSTNVNGALYWSTTSENVVSGATYNNSIFNIRYNAANISFYMDYWYPGCAYRSFAIRCVCDPDTTGWTLPIVSTSAVYGIQYTEAECGGNVISDGGTFVSARGVCWNTLGNPTLADSHTTNGYGTGAFTSHISTLSENTTYYVRAYATNSVGTVYGNEVVFTTPSLPICGAYTITDYDGNVYNTVQIGNQCWMKENLRTTHYANGASISLGYSTSTQSALRYYPDNNSSNVTTYGYLYNWPAVMYGASNSYTNPSGVQGICPTGWHVPSDAEWTQLTDYVSSQSGYMCGSNTNNIAKALASTTGWDSSTNTCAVGNDPNTNNTTGFSALPSGGCAYNYFPIGYSAIFWSTTGSNNPDYIDLTCSSATVYRGSNYKYCGYSVRCLRD